MELQATSDKLYRIAAQIQIREDLEFRNRSNGVESKYRETIVLKENDFFGFE